MLGIGAPLTTTEKRLFISAYIFFVLAALWTLGYWLTSDPLARRNPRNWNRNRRKQANLRSAAVVYHLWQLGGSLACLAGLILAIFLTNFVWQAKELSQMEGVLVPANDPTPTNGCGTPPSDGVIFIYGENGNGVVVRHFPHTIASVESHGKIPECTPSCSILSVDRDAKTGLISVMMDVRSRDNKVIVKLDKDGFHVNPLNQFKLHRDDPSSLSVRDQEDNQALDIRYVNKHALTVDGILHVHGQEIRLYTRGVANSCFKDATKSEFGIGVP
jgi:hypothetical protein